MKKDYREEAEALKIEIVRIIEAANEKTYIKITTCVLLTMLAVTIGLAIEKFI